MRRLALALTALLVVGATSASAATHVADLDTIDAGTHVTDQYRGATGLHFVPGDPEFLPYVTSVGSQAQSGTKVGDIFRCDLEEINCEGAGAATRGRFDTTVSMVQVYVGMFASGSSNTIVTLRAFDGGGTELTGATPPSAEVTPGAGFKTPLTYTSATPNIASFTVTAPNSATGPIGIDDITFETPATPPPPDFSLTADQGTTTIRQGTSVDVPITINRVNGSTGNITFAASGLPTGVTAEFIPNPATGTTTTLRLTAADDAPPPAAGETFPEFTVTATPSASAGSAQRSFTKTIRIERNFTIEIAAGAAAVALPSCLEVDVPVLVTRGSTFTGTVDLAASFPAGDAAGIQASFDPVSVPPGPGTSILRLRVPTSMPTTDREIVVTGSSPDVPSASDSVQIDRVAQTVEATTGLGLTPRRMEPGTEITLRGGGFCAGSKVQFGHETASASEVAGAGPLVLAEPTSISADGSEMTARVPRLGATGKIRVTQPGGPAFQSTGTFTVASYRNTGGFAFDNFGWGNLSFGEMTELFGVQEMFVHVNPCWPWGSCSVSTGVPDPLAFIAWQVIEQIVQSTNGHCFGIALTGQQLQARQIRYNRFSSTAKSPFELPDASGPKAGLGSYLDSQHAAQVTEEFLDHFFDSEESLTAQLEQIQSELRAARQPALSIRNGLTEGHVMTAYDTEAAPDGGVYIYVYDNNTPAVPGELTNLSAHDSAEIHNGRIHINASHSKWTFPGLGWSGGDQTLTTIPYGVIPKDPTLPLSADPTTWLNLVIMFGSSGGAASGEVEGARKAEFVPALDSAATPGSGSHIVRADGPVTHRIDGLEKGRYRDALVVPGFIASVQDVQTKEGVDDAVRYDADGRGLTFAGELDRDLHATLAERVGGDAHTAAVETKTFGGGRDSMQLAGRADRLLYTHQGPATTFSVSLGRAGRNGLPVKFDSRPLRIVRGQKAVFDPPSWRRLNRVRMTLSGGGKRRRVVTLRDRGRFGAGLAITRLTAQRAARRQRLALAARFKRVPADATALTAFRIRKGRKTVARRAVATARVRPGKRTFKAAVKLPRGRYRLTGYLTLTRPGAVPDSRTRTKTIRFRVR